MRNTQRLIPISLLHRVTTVQMAMRWLPIFPPQVGVPLIPRTLATRMGPKSPHSTTSRLHPRMDTIHKVNKLLRHTIQVLQVLRLRMLMVGWTAIWKSQGPSKSLRYISTQAYSTLHWRISIFTIPLTIRRPIRTKQIYPCLVPDCDTKANFKRLADLERHMKTVHFPEPIDCPHGWCGRVGEHGFTRKDHLTDHLREVHMQDIPKASRSTQKGKGSRKDKR